MKLASPRLLVVLALVAAVATGLWWTSRPKPIPVALKEVDRGPVEATLANTRAGTVEACQRTKLSTILGGRIELLAVKEGEHVKKGQLLMKLWNDDQRAQQALAAAQLEQSKRRVGEACALAAVAEREAERTAKLRRDNFVSVAKEDAARAEAEAKRARWASTRRPRPPAFPCRRPST